MRTVLCVAAVVAATAARGDDALAPATLDAVKKATVFLKVEIAGKAGSASGSGFVIRVENDTALVVTNEHVVAPTGPATIVRRPGRPDQIIVPPPADPKTVTVTAAFDSGTKAERSAKATVLAADPDRDLALLKVTGVKDLPAPIPYADVPEPTELMAVYTFGFPFGQALSTSKGFPAVTVGRASVSSLRRDDAGELAVVQIDGALNPGNSGGPLVDAKGRLVGVAVATIKNSSGIGLAIPPNEVALLLRGRVAVPKLTTRAGADGNVIVTADAAVIDPLGQLESVVLYCVPGKPAAEKEPPTDLSKIDTVTEVELKIDRPRAVAEFVLTKAEAQDVQVQVAYKSKAAAGVTVRGKAVALDLSAVKPPAVAVVPPMPPMPGPVPNPVAGPKLPAPPKFVLLRHGETAICGGANNPTFRDAAPAGGVLVGLEVGLGKFFNSDVIHAVRPIYLADGQEVFGRQFGPAPAAPVVVKAKPGYAVSALAVKAGLGVDGLSVTFAKVTGAGLDPADAYTSDWVGGLGGGGPTLLVGEGSAPVGVIGKANAKGNVDGLGLLFPEEGAATAAVGFPIGEKFKWRAPAGGVLVGFEVGTGPRGGLAGFRPVYRVGDKEEFGPQFGPAPAAPPAVVRAKPGYAVGAVTAFGALHLEGFRVTFHKVAGEGLDPADAYASDWVGKPGAGTETPLGGDGGPVIGIHGVEGRGQVVGLGLIVNEPAKK